MLVASLAANEHELADGPCDRIDRMFLDIARIVEQRDVRGEIRVRSPPQSVPGQGRAEHLPTRFELARAIAAHQHERTIARPAAKADAAIENNVEWRHANIRERRAGRTNHFVWQPTE